MFAACVVDDARAWRIVDKARVAVAVVDEPRVVVVVVVVVLPPAAVVVRGTVLVELADLDGALRL